jgi:histidinol-phosphatase (PHP family)
MEGTCRRAIEIGVPALAFTEHADFVPKVHEDLRPLDVARYLEEVDRCRGLFPGLRILSGVELGEPHRFPEETASTLGGGGFDRVLGSVHCTLWGGRLIDGSQLDRISTAEAPAYLRVYLAETLRSAGPPRLSQAILASRRDALP